MYAGEGKKRREIYIGAECVRRKGKKSGGEIEADCSRRRRKRMDLAP